MADRWENNGNNDRLSVQFSNSVVSDSLRPHELQHARPPITNSWSLLKLMSTEAVMPSPTVSSSVIPFSSCPQSLPASESFLMSQLFAWGSQSTGVSALVSFLPKKSQGWSRSWLFILFVYLCFLIGVCKHAKSFQSCPTHCNPMDCSPWGSSLHGILQARILERVVMPSSRGSSWPKDQTHVHWVGGAIQPSHPLSSPSPSPSIFPSIRVFPNESVLQIRWPKYWSFLKQFMVS